MKRKHIIAAGLCVFAIGVIALAYHILTSNKSDVYLADRIAAVSDNGETANADPLQLAGGTGAKPVPVSGDADDSTIISDELQQVFDQTPMSVEKLRNDYQGQLDIPDARRDLIQDYLYFLRKKYPENADDLFAELLYLAFPADIAEQVLATARHLDTYREWFAANRSFLLDLPREERKDLLWNKRVEIFGEEAYELWSGELKRDEIYNAVQLINDAGETTVVEKYDMLDSALKRAYGPDVDAYLENHREELWDEFVSIESVQEDLRSMGAEERRQAMRRVRERLSMPEDAIERLGALDEVRDDRWENGQGYMAARRQITENYQGEEREKMLNLLRRDYFGEEAAIVENEEKAGFFRFERKRQYGKF